MAVLGAILVVAIAAWSFFGGIGSSHQPLPETPAQPQPQATAEKPSDPPVSTKPATADAPPIKKPTLTLVQIVERARTWEPEYIQYIGKPSPEIVAKDLDGKPVKLSDYKGRNVLVVFWATWCEPCRSEIPGLITLRKASAEDKLAIIAISTDRMADDPIINNSMYGQLVTKLKQFAASNKINYTVVTLPGHLEGPYAQINSLPSTFFIDPEGRIKLATNGAMPLKDVEAVLAADK
jgi:peroxiredoxin